VDFPSSGCGSLGFHSYHTTDNEIGLHLQIAFGEIAALMLFSRAGHRLLAGGIILSLSLLFVTQHVAAQGTTQVLTPFGYRDSANLHRVPEGYELMRMPDTHIRMHNPKTGDYTDFPKPVLATQQSVPSTDNQQRVPFTDNGWITYAFWHNSSSKPISYFVTDWSVPPNPRTYTGQTLFQFNSIEPAAENAILQPVLQFGPSAAGGGEYWAITSWYVIGNQAYTAGLYYVPEGTFLGGQIKLIGQKKGGNCSYTSDFYGYSGTTLTVRNIPQLVWATETLEVYGVSQCTEFPNTVYSLMSSIGITLKGGITPSASWLINDSATDCGVQTTTVINSASNGAVAIFY
jgi:hypothetical protein